MSCNIVINQQPSLPASDRAAHKTKAKDQKRIGVDHRGQENYMKNLDYFQQDLSDPASKLMAIEETMRIMKKECNTEINISIGGTDLRQISNQSLAEWSDDVILPTTPDVLGFLRFSNIK